MRKPVALVATVGGDRVDMRPRFDTQRRRQRSRLRHSGSQNGFISHFYLRPDTRMAYIAVFNTDATATEKDSSQDTRRLDREIKDYVFQNIFPLFVKK